MDTIKIEYLDSITAKIYGRDAINFLAPCVTFPKSWWKLDKKTNRKKQIEYEKCMIDKRNGHVLAGLIPRLKRFAVLNGVKCKVIENTEFNEIHDWTFKPTEPKIKGIEFRKSQQPMIEAATKARRGTLTAPTGSGKTILMLGIMSSFPKAKSLLLCHGTDLTRQTAKEFEKYGHKVCIYTSKNMWNETHNIVCSTIQSFSKLPPDKYAVEFDITFIDELHRFSAQFEKVMKNNLCPLRYGVTATFPKDKERALLIEGYLGRIVKRISPKKAQESGLIAKSRVKLITMPKYDTKLWKYPDIYDQFIVENDQRHKKILREIKQNLKEKLTILVMVVKIKHGENLLKVINDAGIDCVFVHGKSTSDLREEVKNDLETKKRKVVIATNIFKEGINIKSLGCMLNAGAEESELKTIQIAGRALRTSNGKDSGKIIDIIDRGKFLGEHALSRVTYYIENKWDIVYD